MSLLEEIEQAIGRPATIELTRVYGGQTLRVPASVQETHPLATAVGVRAANLLCKEFVGMALDIPCERASLIRARNEEIVINYRAGASVRGLAIYHRLSRPMVRKILRASGVQLRSE